MKTIFLKITNSEFEISGYKHKLPLNKLVYTLKEITVKGNNFIITDNNLDYLFKSLSFLYEYQKHLYIKMRSKEIQGITIYEKGRIWKFRNIQNYLKDECTNIVDMEKYYNNLCASLGLDLGSLYHIDNLIRKDFKTGSEYDLNFKNKIYNSTAKYLSNWRPRQLYYIKDDKKFKILNNISKYDLNNYYWDIFKNGLLPYGVPIECEPKKCTHSFSMLEIEIWGKLIDGKIPLLYSIDEDGEANDYEKELFGNKFYISSIIMNRVFEHYHVDSIEIINYTCFETKKINIDGFLNKWIGLQKSQINGDNKTMIKASIHKQIGLFGASSINKSYKVNKNKIILKEGTYRFYEYSPLLLYITDMAKDKMYDYIEKYKDSFVACVVDSIVLESGEFYEPISREIGDWKLVNKSDYGFFKSTTQYVNWNKNDEITYSKQSGVRKNETDFSDLTPKEAIKILNGKRKNTEN